MADCWTNVVTDVGARASQCNRANGFTLVEVLMVVALIGVLGAMVVPISAGMLTRAKSDSSGAEVVTWLEAAKSRANAERRNFQVTFNTGTRRVRIDRVEPDLSTTLVLDRQLPDSATFMQFPGALDTPDVFGAGSAIDFDGPTPHMFTSDGSFIDNNGDPSNGTIFMGKAGQVETVRAITVFGTTGLIRAWKYSGKRWHQ